LPDDVADLAHLASAWRQEVEAVESRHPAGLLYAGRAFREAEFVARALRAPLHVVSAGLGLIAAADRVPAYDLTVAATGATILPLLKRMGKVPADWWDALNHAFSRSRPVVELLKRHQDGCLYLAMPGTYLSMIQRELESLPPADRQRLRIFTSPAWVRETSAALAQSTLPYDDRLESTAYAGTRNDFPQRALRHYIEVIRGHELSLEGGRSAVLDSLSAHSLRDRPVRQKRTDPEIRELLHAHWDAYGGSASRLLRCLRDDLQIQCEQSRFSALWRTVRCEREGAMA
jgi:hypothetical protein